MENLVQELGVLRNEVEKLRNTIDLNMNLLISRTDNVIKKVNEEPKKYRLVRFNIEKAKQGAKIVTASGEDVRILCYDRRSAFEIVALIMHQDDEEEVILCTEYGKTRVGHDSGNDLRILEECV